MLLRCAIGVIGGTAVHPRGGVVTAMMATLAAHTRTREATVLRGNVPEVDRLSVRIVTDNLTQLFVPEETRQGLQIERRVPHSYPDRPRHILSRPPLPTVAGGDPISPPQVFEAPRANSG